MCITVLYKEYNIYSCLYLRLIFNQILTVSHFHCEQNAVGIRKGALQLPKGEEGMQHSSGQNLNSISPGYTLIWVFIFKAANVVHVC